MSTVVEHPVTAEEARDESLPATTEPDLIETTPDGTEIKFFSAPKRHYTIDGEEVVSVTQALDVLHKPALTWWGMKIGVQGVLELVERGELGANDGTVWAPQPGAVSWAPATVERICGTDDLTGLLTEHLLTVNHIRDEAGRRGANVHDALENWAILGKFPDPEEFAPEERGYVRALCTFLTDSGLEAEKCEVLVGSKQHRYAGRYDLRGRIPEEVELVTKVYPKRGPLMTRVPACSLLLDLKSSKGVYPTHFVQLEAYEGAGVENGYDPTDARAVLHVCADGRYEIVRAHADLEDFLAILGAYHALKRVEESLKEGRKR